MTTLEAIRAAKSEPDFKSRVEFYVVAAALAVQSEASGTLWHPERVELAERILENSELEAGRFAKGVVTNGTIKAADSHGVIPDGDIEFVVNSLYDAFVHR